MEEVLPIRPLCFLEQMAIKEDSDELAVPKRLFEKWLDLFPPSMPMIVKVISIETEQTRYVCASSSGPDDAVYCPNWILENLGLTGDEHYVSICPYTDEIATATKICIKLLEEVENQDVRAAIEAYLDRFHVLEPGTTLTVPIDSKNILMYVERTEPAPLVALGGEVLVEFLEEPKLEPEQKLEPEPELITNVPILNSSSTITSTSTLTAEDIRLKRLQHFSKLAINGGQ